jgi:RimJ/RimL family protein N-acetyltransferase
VGNDPEVRPLPRGTETHGKGFMALWEQDNTYTFLALDETTNQIVGIALINQINRAHQVGNLAYLVRTSCAGQGIATQSARLVAQYGFEKLGLQRIEIIVHPDNTPSLKVAQKLGAPHLPWRAAPGSSGECRGRVFGIWF